MVIELINHNYSTCSQKVRLCLHEKGLPFKHTQVNFRAKEHLTPEYLKLNPNGVVPTLVHNGRPVIDSSVIMEYLEEVFPEKPLQSDDPYRRAQMRAWLRFIEEVPTVAIRVPSFNAAFARHYADLSEDEVHANADTRPLRREFYRKMGRDGFDEEAMQGSYEQLQQTISRMDNALAETKWLVGENLSLADYCVVPTIDRMIDLGLDSLIEEAPNVTRWWAAIQSRSAYKLTFVKGSRVSDVYEDLVKSA